MFRPSAITVLLISFLMSSFGYAVNPKSMADMEAEYGPLQGKMELKEHTIFIFRSAKLEVRRETGEGLLKIFPIQADLSDSAQVFSPTSFRSLKRKIARLPAHEQVRYWRLHKIRHPDSDVTAELESALDLMEMARKESIATRIESTNPEPLERPVRYRSGSSQGYSNFYPTYGSNSFYRYRRAIRKDTQIELDRVQRKPRPVESLTSAMSLADRGRSEALSLVSGARSAALSKVNGARSRSLD